MDLTERSIASFLDELGSSSPAPGGGSAAALAGATAAALCAMVCRLTLGKDAMREAWPAMQEALPRTQAIESRLRELIDADAKAYLDVVAARALPRETDAQKAERKAAIQAATVRAASVPLQTLEELRACAPVAELLAVRANPSCITDVGTAGALIRAGALAASYNVRINLPGIADADRRADLAARAREALAEIETAAARIARHLEQALEKGSTS